MVLCCIALVTVIKIKNSSLAGKIPTSGDLQTAELALNLEDRVLYSKKVDGTIIKVSGSIQYGGTSDRPGVPSIGELYYDVDIEAFVYWDGDSWEELTADPNVPTEKPTDPGPGALWWDPDDGQLYIYYEEAGVGGSSQWVAAAPSTGGSSRGDAVAYVMATPPAIEDVGQLWWSLNSAAMFVSSRNQAGALVWAQHA